MEAKTKSGRSTPPPHLDCGAHHQKLRGFPFLYPLILFLLNSLNLPFDSIGAYTSITTVTFKLECQISMISD